MPPFRRLRHPCCLLRYPFRRRRDRQPSYPSHPVKIVVPFPAGGSNDIVARILAQKLTERDGQTFLVENRGGAGGNIGSDAVAASEPDGYTLLLTAPPPLTINIALYKDLKYDPAKAFAPVALVASVPIVLAVHLLARRQERARAGGVGQGKTRRAQFRIVGQRLDQSSRRRTAQEHDRHRIVHIPYKGAAPAMNDLIAGHIPMMSRQHPGGAAAGAGQDHRRHRGGRRATRQRAVRRADGGGVGRARVRRPRPGSGWWRRPTLPRPDVRRWKDDVEPS